MPKRYTVRYELDESRRSLIVELVSDLPKLVTRAEAASVLRRSPRTIDRWIAQGLLRVVRPAGGFPLIPRAEIERLLLEGMEQP